MSAPGAGRASHILQTLMRLKDRLNIAIIEGDLASTLVTHSSRLSHRTLGVWLPNGPNYVDRGLEPVAGNRLTVQDIGGMSEHRQAGTRSLVRVL